MSKWTANDIPDQSGRTFVVTGANSGLGLETTKAIAAKNAQVVMTARSAAKGEAAVKEIKDEIPDANLELRELDLADLASIKTFADGLTKARPQFDVLINNAGVMMTPYQETKDGHELQFGTNHLGHFALTGLLLPHIKGDDPRVVTISSIEHYPGKIDFDNIQLKDGYSSRKAYQRSKFSNAVFGLELARRLEEAGSPIKSTMAHPGYSDTNLQTSGPTGLMPAILTIGNKLIAQSPVRRAPSPSSSPPPHRKRSLAPTTAPTVSASCADTRPRSTSPSARTTRSSGASYGKSARS